MRICQKCVTPENYPGIVFDESGVCNHCREYEMDSAKWQESRSKRRKDFEELVNWATRKQRPYDAVVPLSGGKDSTYTLYLAAVEFKLKVLCFTFDNGFQTEIAKQNISNAIEKASADLVTFRLDRKSMMGAYKDFLRATGMFCPVCMRGISGATFACIRQFRPPLMLKVLLSGQRSG